MTLKDLTSSDWEQLLMELRAFQGTLLYRAYVAKLRQDAATYVTELDSPSTTYERTQYVRGLRAGLSAAEQALADLERRAQPRRA